MNHGRVGGDTRFITAADAGDRNARFEATRDRVEADAFEVRIRDHEGAAFERLDLAAVLRGKVGRLASGIDPEDLLEQQQSTNDDDDGRRISYGVSEGGQLEAIGSDARERAERLGAGPERGRVRRSAGKDAEHGRSVETREPANQWRAHGSEDDNHRSERVHPHSLLAQRGEEAGAELQADGEDEQNQAELLHEIERVMIHRFAEMPDEDAGEEHPRCAEADSAELHAPQRHAEHAYEGEHPDGVRDGLRPMQLEEPAHASGFRRRSLHLGAHAGGVSLEVFVKEAGEFFRGGLVGGFVGPRIARDEDFRRHTGTLGSDLETEHCIALGLGFRKRAVVDRVDNGACVFETDALADAGAAAAPAGIHEPNPRIVLAHLLGEQFGVFARMPDEKRSTEARREGGLRLGDPHFGAGDFRGVAANKVIHRVRGRESAHWWKHAEGVTREENHIGWMAGHARDFSVLDELDRICAARVKRDAGVGVVDAMVFIEDHVFENRAEA